LLLDPSAARPFGKYLDQGSKEMLRAEAESKGIPAVILHYESYGDQCIYLYIGTRAAEKLAGKLMGGLCPERTRELPSDLRLYRAYSFDFERFIERVNEAGIKPALVDLDQERHQRAKYQVEHVGFWTPAIEETVRKHLK
jgi:hypothetical protein